MPARQAKAFGGQMPSIVIRTDSSADIGTGHVMRCLTLADKLRTSGKIVAFVCRELPGNVCSLIEDQDYEVWRLPLEGLTLSGNKDRSLYDRWLAVDLKTDVEQTQAILEAKGIKPEWLIVDHYGIDVRWEQSLRRYAEKIMVIDDLARQHDCDLLLDQNLYDRLESRYDGLVPPDCVRLCGPQYALLREEFTRIKRLQLVRTGRIRNVLVFFGGVDPTNETAKALEALHAIDEAGLMVDVVVGKANPKRDMIQDQCEADSRFNYLCNITNMAELMGRADLALGAGGTTTWERCYLGLPTVVVSVAENQREAMEVADARGALWYLGRHKDVTAADIEAKVQWTLENPDSVRARSNASFRITGGLDIGAEHPVLAVMRETTYAGN